MTRLESLKQVLSAKSAFKFSKPRKCFVNTETKKRFRGISHVIAQTAPPGKGRAAVRVPGPTGRARGSLVDDQVCIAFNGKKALRKPHAYTTKFLQALKSEGMMPIRAQVVVADLEHNIATAVDAVAYRASDDACVLIELKCGFEKSKDKEWTKAYEFTHGLQSAVTEKLFKLTYPNITNVKSKVFRVHSLGVRVYSPCAAARAAVEDTIAKVLVRTPWLSKQRYGRKGSAKRKRAAGGAKTKLAAGGSKTVKAGGKARSARRGKTSSAKGVKRPASGGKSGNGAKRAKRA